MRPSSTISFTDERGSLERGGACMRSQVGYSKAGPPVRNRGATLTHVFQLSPHLACFTEQSPGSSVWCIYQEPFGLPGDTIWSALSPLPKDPEVGLVYPLFCSLLSGEATSSFASLSPPSLLLAVPPSDCIEPPHAPGVLAADSCHGDKLQQVRRDRLLSCGPSGNILCLRRPVVPTRPLAN